MINETTPGFNISWGSVASKFYELGFGAPVIEHFCGAGGPTAGVEGGVPLPEIRLLVPCAASAGAEDFVEIHRWGGVNLGSCAVFSPLPRASAASSSPLGTPFTLQPSPDGPPEAVQAPSCKGAAERFNSERAVARNS
jgi:hypothetical protein